MTLHILVEAGAAIAVLAASIAFGLILYRLSRRPQVPLILRSDMAAAMSAVLEITLISFGIALAIDTLFRAF